MQNSMKFSNADPYLCSPFICLIKNKFFGVHLVERMYFGREFVVLKYRNFDMKRLPNEAAKQNWQKVDPIL
jgi:hypothetical protein